VDDDFPERYGDLLTGSYDCVDRIADTLSQDAAAGRLGQVCDRWIYIACLCFGLDLADQRVLRFEAIVHNAKTLKTGRALEKLPQIVTRLAGMAGRFCTMLDCVDTGFIPDGVLDDLSRLARSSFALPGTPTERRMRCGKPNCRCAADPRAGGVLLV
jgi:hypothetical protein